MQRARPRLSSGGGCGMVAERGSHRAIRLADRSSAPIIKHGILNIGTVDVISVVRYEVGLQSHHISQHIGGQFQI